MRLSAIRGGGRVRPAPSPPAPPPWPPTAGPAARETQACPQRWNRGGEGKEGSQHQHSRLNAAGGRGGGTSISTLHLTKLRLFSKLANSHGGPQETGPVVLRQCQSGLDPKSVGLISRRRTPDHTFWGGQSAPPMSWLCPVICLPCGWWSSGNSQTQNIGAATPSALPAHFSVYSVRRGGECAQEGDPCYTHLHHPALAEAQTLGRGGGAYAFPQDGAKEKLADNPHTRLGKAGVGGSGRRSKGLGSERGPSLQRTTKIPTGKLHCIPPPPPRQTAPGAYADRESHGRTRLLA